jgi:hypothetical protein
MSKVWRMPVALGALTIVGLVGALFGDGVWDLLAAAALAVPVFVGGWYALRRPRSRDANG